MPKSVVVQPEALVFKNTRLNAESQLEVGIRLQGLDGAAMRTLKSGADAGSFILNDGCGAAAANTRCSIAVTFKPNRGGSHHADLQLLDDDWVPLAKVSLDGSGEGPATSTVGTTTPPEKPIDKPPSTGLTPNAPPQTPPPPRPAPEPLRALIAPNPVTLSPQEVGTSSGVVRIQITNTGTAAFTIGYQHEASTEFQLRGTCDGEPVAPKKWCTEEVVFAPRSRGDFVYRIGVLLNHTLYQTLVINASSAQAEISIEPPELVFAAGRETKPVTIANRGDAALRITAASLEGGSGQLALDVGNCIAVHVPAGGSCQMSVTVLRDIRRTPQQASIRLSDSAPDGPRAIAVRADAHFARLAPAPERLDFGRVLVGTSNDLAVVISNTGNAPTGRLTVTAGGGFGIVESQCRQLAPGETCAITLRFTPASAQSYTRSLDVSSINGRPLGVILEGVGFERRPPNPE